MDNSVLTKQQQLKLKFSSKTRTALWLAAFYGDVASLCRLGKRALQNSAHKPQHFPLTPAPFAIAEPGFFVGPVRYDYDYCSGRPEALQRARFSS
jgi:hypothetical protein